VSFIDEMLRTEHSLRRDEVVVPETFKPKSLGSLRLQNPDYLLLAVRSKDGWEFNPAPDFDLQPGFTLIAMTTPLGRMRLEATLAAED